MIWQVKDGEEEKDEGWEEEGEDEDDEGDEGLDHHPLRHHIEHHHHTFHFDIGDLRWSSKLGKFFFSYKDNTTFIKI